jgi:GT2 family glycosyltransferase
LDFPLVSILVLNYNGKKYLKECFDSLLKGTYSAIEIILVDNNSTDESVRFTQENYQQIKIIQTHANKGYSRAYNIAFQYASGKYYVLLNNDIIVSQNWLHPLVETAEKDDSIGALQPKILSITDKDYFEYAGASGGFIDKYGYPFLRGRIFYFTEKDTGQYDDEVEVFWTSGAAMFVKAEALMKSGHLDEDFVHHMEEIDLCWRLHLAGYKLKVIPESTIFHYAGATIKPESYKKLYWNHRNNIFMLMKNLEGKNLLKILFVRYLFDMVNIFYSFIIRFNIRHSFAILSAHFWIISHVFLILKKRQDVQRKRIVKDEAIQKLVYKRSIVMDYFIKKKLTFSSLDFIMNEQSLSSFV